MSPNSKLNPHSHQHADTPTPTEHMNDFTNYEWCRLLLADPSLRPCPTGPLGLPDTPEMRKRVSNTFFTRTLSTDSTIRAIVSLYRPGITQPLTSENQFAVSSRDSLATPPETLFLVSIGTQLDGASGRLHGGVTAALLDHVMGSAVSSYFGVVSATAELGVKYKRAVETPCVVLCRARIESFQGRWVRLRSWVEDGKGGVFAEGEGGFVVNRAAATL